MHRHLLDAILARAHAFDVVIVSTPSRAQTPWWQARLEAGRGEVLAEHAEILCLHEDWKGGAGNGLGTLYALAEADRRIDLLQRLRDGARVAVYHTAGKGTRLAPLPGAEGHNKPGVRLPGLVSIDGEPLAITLLEAVLRQTALYAAHREGRVSVFWGDQLFVPSVAPAPPTHHADILCRLRPFPDAETWEREGLERYGLIAVSASGDAAQVEKIDHATAALLSQRGAIPTDRIGTSLGSFSMSAALTEALLAEFAQELDAREGKLDTDPHFWMPLTLDLDTYREQRQRKGVSAAEADAHHARMRGLATRLEGPLFGAIDVGTDAWWWDYGTLQAWWTNVRRLLDDGGEAEGMRAFFGVQREDGSVVVGGSPRGAWTQSVLVDVDGDVEASGAVIVSCSGRCVVHDGLLYGVHGDSELRDAVLAEGAGPPMRTRLDRDGGADWEVRLPGNSLSYAEWYGRRSEG
ncbi:MAG: hypothetical protein EP330_09540 [Deltaproteobacteria bacterium]|nr:MAG: hypothetical protein EP330_09540 [Deltaproteobacteria bacterium]